MGVGVPYEMPPKGGIMTQGSEVHVETLDFPSRCLINKIVVVQVNGAKDGFTVEFFNALVACGGGSESNSNVQDAGGKIPPELYSITPTFIVPLGTTALKYFSEESTGGAGFTFFNQEKKTGNSNLGNPRKLYMRISPSGHGVKEFAVAIGALAFD